MFLTETDYKGLTDTQTLNVLQQYDALTRQRAEGDAKEEISGYLRPVYDVDATFAATGNNRNPKIVSLMVDITLYNLSTWLPGRMNSDVRIDRYDRAVEYLNKVSAGKVIIDIPKSVDDSGDDIAPQIGYGSAEQNEYDW